MHPVVLLLLHVVLSGHAVRLEARLVYEGCLHHASPRVIGRHVDVGGLHVHPWLHHPRRSNHVHPGGHLLASSVHGNHLVVMVDPHGRLLLMVMPGHHGGVAMYPRVHHLTLPICIIPGWPTIMFREWIICPVMGPILGLGPG